MVMQSTKGNEGINRARETASDYDCLRKKICATAIACLQKLKAMRMLRVLFVDEQRF